VSAALIAVVGIADWATGDQILLFTGHLLPVTILAWGGGVFAGLAGAVVASGVVLVSYVAAAGEFRGIHLWHAIVSLTSGAAVAAAVAGLRAGRDRVLDLLAVERRLARQDSLTGLAATRALHERLTLEVDRMRRSPRPMSLLYLDLDDFKRVNDQRGHVAGDELLVRVARVLEANVRRVDLCARLGGDEFAVLMPETGRTEAHAVAERVRAAMLASFASGGASTGMSGGLGTFLTAPIDAQAPLGLVDGLMYEAKRRGKNCIVEQVFV
jgi:diguanylate cyclase (GGDEF)-like protein